VRGFVPGLRSAFDFKISADPFLFVIQRHRIEHFIFGFKDPGKYEVTAFYHNTFGDEIGLDVVNDKLTSKTVKLTVKEK